MTGWCWYGMKCGRGHLSLSMQECIRAEVTEHPKAVQKSSCKSVKAQRLWRALTSAAQVSRLLTQCLLWWRGKAWWLGRRKARKGQPFITGGCPWIINRRNEGAHGIQLKPLPLLFLQDNG